MEKGGLPGYPGSAAIPCEREHKYETVNRKPNGRLQARFLMNLRDRLPVALNVFGYLGWCWHYPRIDLP